MPTSYPILTHPDPRDMQFLEDRIIEFNYAATGYRDGLQMAIFVRDSAGAIIAGLAGFTWGGAAKIEWLWVREDQRGKGLGRDLLEQAEAEALRRGCVTLLLDTHSFQAPGFYLKHGYQIVGVYEDFPQGFQQICLQKQLVR